MYRFPRMWRGGNPISSAGAARAFVSSVACVMYSVVQFNINFLENHGTYSFEILQVH